jgi:hypothetical protein
MGTDYRPPKLMGVFGHLAAKLPVLSALLESHRLLSIMLIHHTRLQARSPMGRLLAEYAESCPEGFCISIVMRRQR